jgi:hypothetical protein
MRIDRISSALAVSEHRVAEGTKASQAQVVVHVLDAEVPLSLTFDLRQLSARR